MRRRTHSHTTIDYTLKRQIIIAVIIFVVTFVVATILFNIQKTYASDDMSPATLPTITSMAFGDSIGILYGYKEKMDACYMRDSVIPLESDRKLSLNINTYNNNKIDAISYEIRTTDMEDKIAETKITDFSRDNDNNIALNVQLENLTEEGVEYTFIITLTVDGQDIYYYTRILIPTNSYERQLYDFTKYFHETSLNGNANELSMYLETSDAADHNTLSEVTLESSADQIGFGSLRGLTQTDKIIEIKDINPDYCVYEIKYNLTLNNEDGASTFRAKEYYKLRYTPSRVYILDYRRSMQEVLVMDKVLQEDNEINLGITPLDVNYLSNEVGTITCFEQAGELYEYNRNKGRLCKLFSFIDEDTNDIRNINDSHSVKILDIDENGNVDFAIYGYMNSGPHEGYCGINLYRYDAASDKTIEEAFVATTCSYQILGASFSELLYKANDKYFYVMIAGNLVKINLRNNTTENVLTDLKHGQYATSYSGRFLAYTNSIYDSNKLIVEDLYNESTYVIDAKNNTYIRPLAFINEDLVYGYVNIDDIGKDIAGSTIYPISDIEIMQVTLPTHPVIKSYHKDGYYVKDAYLDSHTLTLDRVTKSDNIYIPSDVDTIKDASGEKGRKVDFVLQSDLIRGEVTILKSKSADDQNPIPDYNYLTADMHFSNQKDPVTVDAGSGSEQYFVYVGSQVMLYSNNASDAIRYADEQMGIVVDNNASYIWKRGKKSYINAYTNLRVNEKDKLSSTISKCISTILMREDIDISINSYIAKEFGPLEIMRDAMKDYTVLDLTGCSLTEVLYYVSLGSPVLAITSLEQGVLIVGYDSSSIVTYNPDTSAYSRLNLYEASQQFEDNNNVFISYTAK